MTPDLNMPTAWLTPALLQDAPSGGSMLGDPTSSGNQSITSSDGSAQPTTTGQPGGLMGQMPFLILLMFGAMILMMSLSGRKDKKRRAQMLSSLNRKDKIQTAGGIIGTIVEMKDNEVLVETDRASHTRLWLAKGSISSVIKQSKQAETSDEDTSAASA